MSPGKDGGGPGDDDDGDGFYLDVETVKPYLPAVVGCAISKDMVLHMRWKISYPNPTAPFVFSRVWNAGRTDRALASGEECPFDLEGGDL